MEQYIWLLPILFVFHDFEEIIGARLWATKNGAEICRRIPKATLIFNDLTTEGFALAVAEEFVIILIICGLTFTGIRAFGLLWLGVFFAYTLHLAVHIGQAIVFRKYIPALTTSIICLPVSIWIFKNCLAAIDASFCEIALYCLVATVATVVNLLFAHKLSGKYSKWINNKLKQLDNADK